MIRLRGPTWKRLAIDVAILACAVVLLAPRGTHGEQCCICGLTRRTRTLAGITYWSALEEMSGCEGLHEWYQRHVGTSHRHHWHRVSSNTSWLWWGTLGGGKSPAYALHSLATNRPGWSPEEQKAFIEKYATVISCEGVGRFCFEYYRTKSPDPDAKHQSGE